MADYKTQLDKMRTAQRNAAIADLENTRSSALSDLQAEEAKINPTYAGMRTQASNASKVNARNFQEYLANTGRANSGIGAQYEMNRQNSLNRDINALNAQQAQDVADIARRRTLANDAYNSGLASANAQIEANYIQNLLAQQQQAWENKMAEKQFNESVRQFNVSRSGYGGSSGGSYSRSSSGKKKGTTPENNTKQATYTPSNAALAAEAEIAKGFSNKQLNKGNLMNNAAGAYINKLYNNGKGSLSANDVYYLTKKFGL